MALIEPPPPILTDAGPLDAEQLAELHARSLDQDWAERPWDWTAWTRIMIMTGVFGAIAAPPAGEPSGFAVARAVAGEAEMIMIGVVPKARRHGLGGALLSAVMARGAALGAAALVLEVAESNQPARELYDRAGFIVTGRRKNYYLGRNGRHDALVLRRSLSV